jgi:copper chaperone CopZ
MTRRDFKIFVFCLLLNLLAIGASAQFREARIGINGLTCSQCSRSVEIQLRKLPFVQDIQMDLEHTQGKITFKANKPVNIKAIAQAVKDAGFSVRYLKADINRQDVQLSVESCFKLYDDVYYMSPAGSSQDRSVLTLQFLGKDYIAKSELKRYKLPAATSCKGKVDYYTVATNN